MSLTPLQKRKLTPEQYAKYRAWKEANYYCSCQDLKRIGGMGKRPLHHIENNAVGLISVTAQMVKEEDR